ncbi:uncharacterized protein LOC129899851 [Solanum dulcamara]|uniref:uncharacterized protein LOC129899851 n=1 Tax=Solanum dulcamara TaxID=45834 RepID=UPI0024855BC7|nr:uncharacterized protein LOC129899851 [Solanum dulcamara]
MTLYEALYGQKCRSLIGWFDVGETQLMGPDIVQQEVEKGKVAYELDLPADLEAVHPVFHVSMLRRCVGDPSRVYSVNDIQVTEELDYEEHPVAILDRQIRRLQTKDVASVKVLWRNRNREEMT